MKYSAIYMYIQLLAFGILFPIGAVLCILQKKITEKWLHYHLACQGFAVFLVLVGFVILYIHAIFYDDDDITDNSNAIFHKIGGLVVAVAGTIYTFL